MIRKILSIIAGYAIFAVTALAFFKLSKQDPHADPAALFVILTAVYGVICSFLAGLVTQLIASTKNFKINYVLAFIIAGFLHSQVLNLPVTTGHNCWRSLSFHQHPSWADYFTITGTTNNAGCYQKI